MFTNSASTGAFGAPIPDGGFGSDRAHQQQTHIPVGGFAPDRVNLQQQRQLQQQPTTKHNGSSPICVKAIAAMPCELKSFADTRLEDHIAANRCTRGQPVLESLPPDCGGFNVTLGESIAH